MDTGMLLFKKKEQNMFTVSSSRIVGKGLLLGFSASMAITLVESFYMLLPDLYVPPSYPLLLMVFNIPFWTIVGGLLAVSLRLCMIKNSVADLFTRNENLCWHLFFLVPVTLFYGILCRLFINIWPWFATTNPSPFDGHLYAAIIAGFLVISYVLLKKNNLKRNNYRCLFLFEIAVIAMLYFFCPNIATFGPFKDICATLQAESSLQLNVKTLLFFIYVAGVMTIAVMYAVALYARKTFLYSVPTGIKVLIVVIMSTCFLAGSYAWKANVQDNWVAADSTVSARPFSGETQRVILVVLDTFRADLIELPEYANATKNLRKLAQESLFFENCVATAPWTVPSHASLFTGLYPTEHGSHGVLEQGETNVFGDLIHRPLLEEFLTLPEIFREHGYATAGVISNFLLDQENGFSQGFNLFHSYGSVGRLYNESPFRPPLHLFSFLTNVMSKYALYYMSADDITRESIRAIDVLSDQPFFLFINYLDVHEPYCPPRPFLGATVDKIIPQLYSLEQHLRRRFNRLSKKAWFSFQRQLYNGEVAYLDHEIGNLISYLKKKGLYDDSLIIITSDHGELFGEHGSYSHRKTLYDDELRVPLIVKLPFSKQVGRRSQMMDLCDTFATMLSLCGLPSPPGISGTPFGDNSSLVLSEYFDKKTGHNKALYSQGYKYITYEHQKNPELYNLATDPEESSNLAGAKNRMLDQMIENMSSLDKKITPKYKEFKWENEGYMEEVQEKLKALGYIQ
jgi:arylsulfatase A-like enzyme